MTRYNLLATVAIVAVATPSMAATHHHRHHVVTKRHHAVKHASTGLATEVAELRDEVRNLQQRLAEQAAGQASIQAQTAGLANAVANQAPPMNDSAQVAALTAQQAALTARVGKVEHPDKLAYKGITITPGGFLDMTGVYRSKNVASDVASNFNQIPYANNRVGRTGEFRFSARTTRVSGLVEGAPSKTLKLSGYVEFDFLGAAQTANSNSTNSYNPRLRNAYANVDYTLSNGTGVHFLAGQNWSLVTTNSKGITPRNEVQPASIDVQYVPGYAFARQPQFRTTIDMMDHTLWAAVSLENAQTTFATPGYMQGAAVGSAAAAPPVNSLYNVVGQANFNNANTISLNRAPDVVGKVAYEGKFSNHTVHAEAFGIYRNFYNRVNGNPAQGVVANNVNNALGTPTKNSSADGYGGGGSLLVSVVPGFLDAQVSGMYGRGIGRYGASGLPDVTFRPDGSIKPIREYMLLAGVIAHPNKFLDIYGFAGEEVMQRVVLFAPNGVAYGYGNPNYTNYGCNIEASAVCNGQTKSVRQAEVGFWQRLYQGPWGRMQVGAEYSHTIRRSFAGVGGTPNTKQDTGFFTVRYYPF